MTLPECLINRTRRRIFLKDMRFFLYFPLHEHYLLSTLYKT